MAGMSGEHHQELQQAYKSVWDEEEEQREAAWLQLLMRNTVRESGKEYDIKQLADIGLHEVITVHDTLMSDLVLHGFPMCLRGEGWKLLLDVSVRRHKGHYKMLVQQTLGDLAEKQTISLDDIKSLSTMSDAALDSSGSQVDLGQAANPLRSAPNSPSWNGAGPTWQSHARVWLQQIEKDLPRTFASHPSMQPVSGGRQALRRVLAAYTMHDSATGYCQGMNYIAAVLLMFMPEEDAFWCLAIIVEQVLAGYFAPDMMAIKVDQRVFQQLVSSQLPAVATHLQAVGADIACLFAQWFLCAFVNSLPLETCYRVWDVLFYRKSSAILFQVGLALVDMYGEALLAAHDLLEAFQVVQGMASLTHDATRLLGLAMHKYSFLSKEHLEHLRRQARVLVEREMEEEKRAEAERQLRQQGLSDSIKPLQDTNNRMQTYMRKFWAQVNLRFEGGRAAAGGSDSDTRAGRITPEHDGDEDGEQEHEGGPIQLAAIQQASSSQASAGKKRASALISAFATGAQALKGSGQQSTAGLFGSNAAASRAGNHQIPDAADSPLLIAPNGMGAAPSTGLADPLGVHADDVHGSYVPPDAAVAHFPPTRELIPPQGDLISLSQSFSTALPDLDDLLMRDESTGFASLPAPLTRQPQPSPMPTLQSPNSLPNAASPTPQPPQPGGSEGDAQGSGSGFGFNVISPVKAGLVSRPLQELPSEVDPPSPKQGLETSSILKQIDSTLWAPPDSRRATQSPSLTSLVQDPFSASPALRLPSAGTAGTANENGAFQLEGTRGPVSAGAGSLSAPAAPNADGASIGEANGSGRMSVTGGKAVSSGATQRHSVGSTGDHPPLPPGSSTGFAGTPGSSTAAASGMPSRLSGTQSPQLSSAMKIAFKIAMNQNVDPASTGSGAPGSTGSSGLGKTSTSVPHTAASTGSTSLSGSHVRSMQAAPTGSIQRASASGLPPHTSTAAVSGPHTNGSDNAAATGKLAGWGMEGLGSATSAVSLGMSSGHATEDLEMHPFAGQHRGMSGLSHALQPFTSGSELKDDWVDLHVADELSVHSRQSSMPGVYRSYTGGGHHGGIPTAMHSMSTAGAGMPRQQHMGFAPARPAGAVGQQQVFNGALLALVHQQPTAVSSSTQASEPESGELRKTISNGWVDGSLGTSLPNHGSQPGSHMRSLDRDQAAAQPPAASEQFPPGTAVTGGFASVQAAQDIREKEGIQQLLARCNDLNAQFQRSGLQASMPTSTADIQGSGSEVGEGVSKPGALHLSLMASGAQRCKQQAAEGHADDKALKSAQDHLQHASDELIALATITRPASHMSEVSNGSVSNGHSVQQKFADIRRRADAAAYFVRVATQELSGQLQNTACAAGKGIADELLGAYRVLASQSCAKLQAMAQQQAEQEAAHALLQDKLHQVTEQLASKDEVIGQLQAQLDAAQQQHPPAGNVSLLDNLKDMRNRLRGNGSNQQQAPTGAAPLQVQLSHDNNNSAPPPQGGLVSQGGGADASSSVADGGPNRLLAAASRFFKPAERGPSPPLQHHIFLNPAPVTNQQVTGGGDGVGGGVGGGEQRGVGAGSAQGMIVVAPPTLESDGVSGEAGLNASAVAFQHAAFQRDLVNSHGSALGIGLPVSTESPPIQAANTSPTSAMGGSSLNSGNVAAGDKVDDNSAGEGKLRHRWFGKSSKREDGYESGPDPDSPTAH